MYKTVGFSKMIWIDLCSGQRSDYCLLILTNVIFYNLKNIEYNMDEKLISASRTIKDLGIIFEDNFQFDEHMSKIINNANSKLGIIKNTFMN